jgi:hypothetical protein
MAPEGSPLVALALQGAEAASYAIAEWLASGSLMVWIVEPRALIHKLLPVTKRKNPPKSKLFGIVACPKAGIAKFSHLFDQSGQTWCHLQLFLLVIYKWQKQMSVHPLRGNMHINLQPSLGRTSLGALEGGIDIFLSTMAT